MALVMAYNDGDHLQAVCVFDSTSRDEAHPFRRRDNRRDVLAHGQVYSYGLYTYGQTTDEYVLAHGQIRHSIGNARDMPWPTVDRHA